MNSARGTLALAVAALLCLVAGSFAGLSLATAGDQGSGNLGSQAAEISGQSADAGEEAVRDPQFGSKRTESQWPVNSHGQTYGPSTDAGDPDLILAQATNGQAGYVRSQDLEPPEFGSPSEAHAYSAAQTGAVAVPVYESDGITVIGEFLIVPGIIEELDPDTL